MYTYLMNKSEISIKQGPLTLIDSKSLIVSGNSDVRVEVCIDAGSPLTLDIVFESASKDEKQNRKSEIVDDVLKIYIDRLGDGAMISPWKIGETDNGEEEVLLMMSNDTLNLDVSDKEDPKPVYRLFLTFYRRARSEGRHVKMAEKESEE